MARRKIRLEPAVEPGPAPGLPAAPAYRIGIDLGGTNIKFGVVSAAGRIVKRVRIPTNASKGPKPALRRMVKVIRHLARDYPVASIGVGAAGLVDHTRGIIRLPPNLPGWDGTPVREALQKATGLPAFVGNDANAFVLGEFLFGAGRGRKDVFGITLGTGIGGGIIANRRLVLGANHSAGEIGHTIIFPDGQLCACGSRGCLECYGGAAYIVERTVALLRTLGPKTKARSLIRKYTGNRPDQLTPQIISRAAHHGDSLALEVIHDVGYYVGLGIVNAIRLLDPEVVVIGGGVSGFGKPLLDSVRRTVDERIIRFPGWNLEIAISALGDDAGILGASQFPKYL